MATGYLELDPASGTPGASNPMLSRRTGSEGAPTKVTITALFDPTTDEHLWFKFRMPGNYASAPTAVLQWSANATSGTVRWGAALAAITAADADTPVEHAVNTASTAAGTVNATEAHRLTDTSITISTTDSAAAGDLIFLLVYRDADGTSGTDDCSVDAELWTVEFQYTTT